MASKMAANINYVGNNKLMGSNDILKANIKFQILLYLYTHFIQFRFKLKYIGYVQGHGHIQGQNVNFVKNALPDLLSSFITKKW